MTDIILQIGMIIGAGLGGYGICQLRNPKQKRDRNGRFAKKG